MSICCSKEILFAINNHCFATNSVLIRVKKSYTYLKFHFRFSGSSKKYLSAYKHIS